MPRVKRSAGRTCKEQPIKFCIASIKSTIQIHTYALPFAHPTVFGTHHSNQPIEIVARAIVNIVLIVFHPQKFFTIVASIVLELLEWLHQSIGNPSELSFHAKTECVFWMGFYSPSPKSRPNRHVIHANLWEWFRKTFCYRICLFKSRQWLKIRYSSQLLDILGFCFCFFFRLTDKVIGFAFWMTAEHLRWVRSVCDSSPMKWIYLAKMFKFVLYSNGKLLRYIFVLSFILTLFDLNRFVVRFISFHKIQYACHILCALPVPMSLT